MAQHSKAGYPLGARFNTRGPHVGLRVRLPDLARVDGPHPFAEEENG